ncbi:FtsK/SpoIIIE domain-containing protein [Peribacillus simplex]|uniref:FtsK/SpoIIIE domain-containing protein n=1 Tax=Peribacillus simplex TaxID=1478 RepID=UPI002E1B4A1F|nr:FtsK/SpoIIIE domain-containing protein [Peribacillus simplex]
MIREFLYKSKAKAELIKAFRSAGLHKTYKSKGGTERTIFPQIHDIHLDKENKTLRYTFTLLNGMDPKEVKKKEFVFRQHFGRSISLEGDLKKYVLTIYATSMPKELPYKVEGVREAVSPFTLGIICGKDRNGQYNAFDLLKQPHILIAGETGSGKSTQLRSILTTLILTKKPSELKLYLGDCKKSEFHIFRKVEHVQCVLSNAKDIGKMLRGIKKELDERSDLTEIFEVGHVDDLPAEHRRPYLVVCIDEFVMLRRKEEIMEILTEVVAIGRTLGVFAILSMQRPNAKVLDTTIRANLTVSMGFKLRDVIESRIVNTPGAEAIETSGRFIMNSDKLYELQAPYLTIKKAKELLNPFVGAKGPVKEVTPEEPTIKELTEKDVFNDVVD